MDKKFTTLKKYSHKVGKNFWHIEFATKYRYKMFRKFKQKNLVEAAIRRVAVRHKIKIHSISVMPEHVRMLVTLAHNIIDSKALMLLKGGSAHTFFKNHAKSRLRLLEGTSGVQEVAQSLSVIMNIAQWRNTSRIRSITTP